MTGKIIALDLFCGAGGLTRGLLDAGIEVRYGIDFNENFRKTYELNNIPAKYFMADVKILNGKDLERLLDIQTEDKFMVAACAPCQPFSKHNKNHKYDRRKSLLLEVGRIINEFEKKPDFIFIENVPAIKKVDEGRIFKNFCRILQQLDYTFKADVIDAKDYGIPQTRKRFVMIAVKKEWSNEKIDFPNKTHGKDLLPYKTVKDAISHLPAIKAGNRSSKVANHESANLSKLNKLRLSCVPKDGGLRSSWPQELWLNCHKKHEGHMDVYGRMKWDSPSPTLTCKCISISNGRFGHPSQKRAISLREAASLQTFSDNYVFYGNLKNMSMQIGNAVPVLLAEIFGRYIVKMLQRNSEDTILI